MASGTETLSASLAPVVRPVGLDGILVSFGETLTEPANRAALAFSAAVARAGWDGVEECAPTLVSVYLRFDPLHLDHRSLEEQLRHLISSRDWYAALLPEGRRFIRVPTVYGTEVAPQLDEAATAAGMSAEDAVRSISQSRVRVQTIGFAPGQPYLGLLPEAWDIPRQSELTRSVPIGALVVAIRQLVLFSVSTPTGWRHIGQTGLRLFRPDDAEPFFLRPGDEVQFVPVEPTVLDRYRDDPAGGAEIRALD